MSKQYVYIAGPFFNDQQLEVIENIKKLLDSLDLSYFSPKDRLRFNKSDPPEKAAECFKLNVEAMNKADLMIAVIDDFDTGTIFEMGFFSCLGKDILAFSNIPGRGLNLMLSQSCIGFSNGMSDLADKIVKINSDNYNKEEFKGEQH